MILCISYLARSIYDLYVSVHLHFMRPYITWADLQQILDPPQHTCTLHPRWIFMSELEKTWRWTRSYFFLCFLWFYKLQMPQSCNVTYVELQMVLQTVVNFTEVAYGLSQASRHAKSLYPNVDNRSFHSVWKCWLVTMVSAAMVSFFLFKKYI